MPLNFFSADGSSAFVVCHGGKPSVVRFVFDSDIIDACSIYNFVSFNSKTQLWRDVQVHHGKARLPLLNLQILVNNGKKSEASRSLNRCGITEARQRRIQL